MYDVIGFELALRASVLSKAKDLFN